MFFWKIDWHDIIVQEKKDEKRWKKWRNFLGLVNVIVYKSCCEQRFVSSTLISLITVEVGINVERVQKLQNQ